MEQRGFYIFDKLTVTLKVLTVWRKKKSQLNRNKNKMCTFSILKMVIEKRSFGGELSFKYVRSVVVVSNLNLRLSVSNIITLHNRKHK